MWPVWLSLISQNPYFQIAPPIQTMQRLPGQKPASL